MSVISASQQYSSNSMLTFHTSINLEMNSFIVPPTVSQQPGMQSYGDPYGAMTTALTPVYPGQTTPAHMMSSYPPPPSYCNHPPPSYEQVFRNAEKKSHSQSSQ
ncbi:hypothetical protein cypCar_00047673 [Cyprinus carpio]|nr:hypothetical protein cypCar_00047673 [Cyprinus carpio]